MKADAEFSGRFRRARSELHSTSRISIANALFRIRLDRCRVNVKAEPTRDDSVAGLMEGSSLFPCPYSDPAWRITSRRSRFRNRSRKHHDGLVLEYVAERNHAALGCQPAGARNSKDFRS
jgi:hypothetical protein